MIAVIVCPICGIQNDDNATICSQCKAFLQAKVDTLDFFSTMWGMIESPVATLKKVALSRSKNYVSVLCAASGLMLVFGYVWFHNIGNSLEGLLSILGLGMLLGPFVGFVFMTSLAMLVTGFSKAFGGKRAYRNTFAVLSYSATPLVFAFVILFPVEIAVFGQYFFGSNPHPMVIRPDLYIILVGLNALASAWTITLAIAGTRVSSSLSFSRAAVVLMLSLGTLAGTAEIVRMVLA